MPPHSPPASAPSRSALSADPRHTHAKDTSVQSPTAHTLIMCVIGPLEVTPVNPLSLRRPHPRHPGDEFVPLRCRCHESLHLRGSGGPPPGCCSIPGGSTALPRHTLALPQWACCNAGRQTDRLGSCSLAIVICRVRITSSAARANPAHKGSCARERTRLRQSSLGNAVPLSCSGSF
jgi:hypothetical protein